MHAALGKSAAVGVTMASEAYRAMARECYELARQTEDDVERRELILLAARWAELAELKKRSRTTRSFINCVTFPNPLRPPVSQRALSGS